MRWSCRRHPQGLKPAWFVGVCGTTEVVPCYKAALDDFSASREVVPGYKALECGEQVGPEDNCRCFDSSARRTSLNMTALLMSECRCVIAAWKPAVLVRETLLIR